jgi:hypothetical protein
MRGTWRFDSLLNYFEIGDKGFVEEKKNWWSRAGGHDPQNPP